MDAAAAAGGSWLQSKHQLQQPSHVFQRTVGARWNSAAHRGPAIDIQLTGGWRSGPRP